jgi:hypothetical protein
MRVALRPQYFDFARKVELTITLEAGQLDTLAKQVAMFFGRRCG